MRVQLQKATKYHYWRAVMAIFPLAPDQTIAQMWSNGVRGDPEYLIGEGAILPSLPHSLLFLSSLPSLRSRLFNL